MKGKIVIVVLVLCMIAVFSVAAGGQKEAAPASGDQEEATMYKLRFGNVFSNDHPVGQGGLKFAEIVEEKTNGRVTVEVYPSMQLGSEKDMFDSVAMGTLDFSLVGPGEPGKRFSPLLVLEAPYIFKDRDHFMRVLNDKKIQGILFEKMIEQSGIRAVCSFYYGTRYLTTGDTLVRTPEDVAGLKIRIPETPMLTAIMRYMGATPMPMAFSEVYLALQQGVIDGQENPYATIYANKFYEVQDYVMDTAHQTGPLFIVANEKRLNKLPQDLKDAIIEAGNEAGKYTSALMFSEEDRYLEKLKNEKSIEFIKVDRAAFEERMKPLYEEYEEKWGSGLAEMIRSIQ